MAAHQVLSPLRALILRATSARPSFLILLVMAISLAVIIANSIMIPNRAIASENDLSQKKAQRLLEEPIPHTIEYEGETYQLVEKDDLLFVRGTSIWNDINHFYDMYSSNGAYKLIVPM